MDSIQRRVVSVGGGKGGVGKSVVAANLAVAMAQAGARVVLVDVDLGAANQHTLFGISRPGPGIQAFLNSGVESLEEVEVETPIPGLRLVPGTSGVVGDTNLPFARKVKLVRHVRALKADVVVVDVGAGMTFNTLDLFVLADFKLVVMTPQLTSAQNAYGFLKGAVFRELRRIASVTGQQARIDEAEEGSSPTSSATKLLERLAAGDPRLASDLRSGLVNFGARLVGNQVFQPSDANVLYALSRMARDFLGLEVPVLGALRASRHIHNSVNGGRPYMLTPESEKNGNGASFREIAQALLTSPLPGPSQDRPQGPDDPRTPSEAGPLPADVSAYERADERIPVDFGATLIYPSGLATVILRDVSARGALLEMERPPPSGTRVTLVLSRLSEQPRVACIVKHSDSQARRAGVEFIIDPETSSRIVERIRRDNPKDESG